MTSLARFVLVGCALASFGLASAQSTETVDVTTGARRTSVAAPPAHTVHNTGSTKTSSYGWNNGPFITGVGNGFSGGDTSAVQTGFTTLGYGMQGGTINNRLADDFVTPVGATVALSTLVFRAYQTGAPTTGTMTGINANIWNTMPLTGNLPDQTGPANSMTSQVWSGVYRVTTTTLLSSTRAIIDVTSDMTWATPLAAGTFWADASMTGSLASGPFAPPTTPAAGTDNARQFIGSTSTWNPVIDGLALVPQDFPFLLTSSSGGSRPTVTSVSPAGGGEGTSISVTGSNFGTTPDDLKLLLADGIGFADVISASGTSLTATVFKVGSTGTGPITVIRGSGLPQPNQSSSVGGITSNSTSVLALVGGLGPNFGSFNLSPGSANTVSVKAGSPLPGGISLDLTGLGGAGVANFCTSKTSSLGCLPSLTTTSAAASKSGAPAVTIAAGPVPGGAGLPGILIYAKTSPAAPISTNFGFLCLNGFARAGAFPASPGGTPGTCTGNYTWNIAAIAAGSGNIAVGDMLRIQGWYRDPPNPPGGANLTHGLDAVTIFSEAGSGQLYRLAAKSTGGVFSVYQGRIDFVGVPTSAQRASHLADHLNQSFGSFGVSAGASGTFVRVSMAGAAYSGIVVAGI